MRLRNVAFKTMITRSFIPVLALALITAPSNAMPGSKDFEGQWQNPKRTTFVNVSVCGEGPQYCAVVMKASAETLENARKGGTTHFIGTEVLRVHRTRAGVFKGTAFDPETNMHVSATVRMVAPGVIEMKGCAMMGLFCERQRWTKVE